MTRLVFAAYGLLTYLLFLGVFLYAAAFVANIPGLKTMDNGPAGTLTEAIVVDLLLLGLFAVQHSVMARPAFKRWWIRFVPPVLERSTYVLFASVALALLFWQWRPVGAPLWAADGAAGTALQIVSVTGWGMVLVSTFLINHFELFGLRQSFAPLLGLRDVEPVFRTPGLYRAVRHPIYLGFLLAFWATPVMTAGHLLFALMTTGYILVGIALEEHDLVEIFGGEYQDYRQRVGMLFPRVGAARAPRSRVGIGKAGQP
ncbi:MAG: isoprenylcysteine carboxylmethyltransferase family protein [Ramlibacter sp.]|nr:isoprenylcysteine carboxylmethyltransferase family protein [Ramlibacter sp.]